MGPDDRVRTALLVGVTVAALAVGAWWWRDAAPVLGPTGGPSPSPSGAAFLQPGVRLVDPVTGQPLVEPGQPLVVHQEPGEPPVIHQEPGEAPVLGGVVSEEWHERSHLVPGDRPLARLSRSSGATQYLLSIRCTGPGTVVVEFSGARYDPSPHNVRCAQSSETVAVEASGRPLLVRFAAVEGELDLDARLSALP
ncbi:hypothetical protein ACL02O_11420 [Micromonospora sp. MS34]|uniref:hypothetical protein n=1 Tax=Micromonospora sp. MS34 TaxID=3385971 RepID=UPI0039A3C782